MTVPLFDKSSLETGAINQGWVDCCRDRGRGVEDVGVPEPGGVEGKGGVGVRGRGRAEARLAFGPRGTAANWKRNFRCTE